MFVLWIVGGGGGGDVKLMAAIGAWLGLRGTLTVFLASVVVAAVISIGFAIYRRMREVSHDPARGRLGKQRILIPYAVPVAVATWAFQVTLLVLHASLRGA